MTRTRFATCTRHVVLAVLAAACATSMAGELYFLGLPGPASPMGLTPPQDADASRSTNPLLGLRNNNATGFKATLGYRLSPGFALEGGYADAKSQDMQFYGLGFMPVSEQFSVFGKVGSTLGMGFGGVYQLTDKLGLRAELEKSSPDANQITFGLQAKF
jgi:hypothetical protein